MYKLLHSKGSHQQNKDNLWTGRKYLQMMQATGAKFTNYTNGSYNSTTKNSHTSIKKIGRRLKQTFLQQRHTDGR